MMWDKDIFNQRMNRLKKAAVTQSLGNPSSKPKTTRTNTLVKDSPHKNIKGHNKCADNTESVDNKESDNVPKMVFVNNEAAELRLRFQTSLHRRQLLSTLSFVEEKKKQEQNGYRLSSNGVLVTTKRPDNCPTIDTAVSKITSLVNDNKLHKLRSMFLRDGSKHETCIRKVGVNDDYSTDYSREYDGDTDTNYGSGDNDNTERSSAVDSDDYNRRKEEIKQQTIKPHIFDSFGMECYEQCSKENKNKCSKENNKIKTDSFTDKSKLRSDAMVERHRNLTLVEGVKCDQKSNYRQIKHIQQQQINTTISQEEGNVEEIQREESRDGQAICKISEIQEITGDNRENYDTQQQAGLDMYLTTKQIQDNEPKVQKAQQFREHSPAVVAPGQLVEGEDNNETGFSQGACKDHVEIWHLPISTVTREFELECMEHQQQIELAFNSVAFSKQLLEDKVGEGDLRIVNAKLINTKENLQIESVKEKTDTEVESLQLNSGYIHEEERCDEIHETALLLERFRSFQNKHKQLDTTLQNEQQKSNATSYTHLSHPNSKDENNEEQFIYKHDNIKSIHNQQNDFDNSPITPKLNNQGGVDNDPKNYVTKIEDEQEINTQINKIELNERTSFQNKHAHFNQNINEIKLYPEYRQCCKDFSEDFTIFEKKCKIAGDMIYEKILLHDVLLQDRTVLLLQDECKELENEHNESVHLQNEMEHLDNVDGDIELFQQKNSSFKDINMYTASFQALAEYADKDDKNQVLFQNIGKDLIDTNNYVKYLENEFKFFNQNKRKNEFEGKNEVAVDVFNEMTQLKQEQDAESDSYLKCVQNIEEDETQFERKQNYFDDEENDMLREEHQLHEKVPKTSGFIDYDQQNQQTICFKDNQSQLLHGLKQLENIKHSTKYFFEERYEAALEDYCPINLDLASELVHCPTGCRANENMIKHIVRKSYSPSVMSSNVTRELEENSKDSDDDSIGTKALDNESYFKDVELKEFKKQNEVDDTQSNDKEEEITTGNLNCEMLRPDSKICYFISEIFKENGPNSYKCDSNTTMAAKEESDGKLGYRFNQSGSPIEDKKRVVEEIKKNFIYNDNKTYIYKDDYNDGLCDNKFNKNSRSTENHLSNGNKLKSSPLMEKNMPDAVRENKQLHDECRDVSVSRGTEVFRTATDFTQGSICLDSSYVSSSNLEQRLPFMNSGFDLKEEYKKHFAREVDIILGPAVLPRYGYVYSQRENPEINTEQTEKENQICSILQDNSTKIPNSFMDLSFSTAACGDILDLDACQHSLHRNLSHDCIQPIKESYPIKTDGLYGADKTCGPFNTCHQNYDVLSGDLEVTTFDMSSTCNGVQEFGEYRNGDYEQQNTLHISQATPQCPYSSPRDFDVNWETTISSTAKTRANLASAEPTEASPTNILSFYQVNQLDERQRTCICDVPESDCNALITDTNVDECIISKSVSFVTMPKVANNKLLALSFQQNINKSVNDNPSSVELSAGSMTQDNKDYEPSNSLSNQSGIDSHTLGDLQDPNIRSHEPLLETDVHNEIDGLVIDFLKNRPRNTDLTGQQFLGSEDSVPDRDFNSVNKLLSIRKSVCQTMMKDVLQRASVSNKSKKCSQTQASSTSLDKTEQFFGLVTGSKITTCRKEPAMKEKQSKITTCKKEKAMKDKRSTGMNATWNTIGQEQIEKCPLAKPPGRGSHNLTTTKKKGENSKLSLPSQKHLLSNKTKQTFTERIPSSPASKNTQHLSKQQNYLLSELQKKVLKKVHPVKEHQEQGNKTSTAKSTKHLTEKKRLTEKRKVKFKLTTAKKNVNIGKKKINSTKSSLRKSDNKQTASTRILLSKKKTEINKNSNYSEIKESSRNKKVTPTIRDSKESTARCLDTSHAPIDQCTCNASEHDCTSDISKDICTCDVTRDECSSDASRDECSSDASRDYCTSDVPIDYCTYVASKDDNASLIPKDQFTSDIPNDDSTLHASKDDSTSDVARNNCTSEVTREDCTFNTPRSGCSPDVARYEGTCGTQMDEYNYSNVPNSAFTYDVSKDVRTSDVFKDACTSDVLKNNCTSDVLKNECNCDVPKDTFTTNGHSDQLVLKYLKNNYTCDEDPRVPSPLEAHQNEIISRCCTANYDDEDVHSKTFRNHYSSDVAKDHYISAVQKCHFPSDNPKCHSAADVHQSPCNDDVNQSPSNDDVHPSPCTDDVHQSPRTDDVYQSPCTKEAHQSPCTDDVHQSPCTNDVHQNRYTANVVDNHCVSDTSRDYCTSNDKHFIFDVFKHRSLARVVRYGGIDYENIAICASNANKDQCTFDNLTAYSPLINKPTDVVFTEKPCTSVSESLLNKINFETHRPQFEKLSNHIERTQAQTSTTDYVENSDQQHRATPPLVSLCSSIYNKATQFKREFPNYEGENVMSLHNTTSKGEFGHSKIEFEVGKIEQNSTLNSMNTQHDFSESPTQSSTLPGNMNMTSCKQSGNSQEEIVIDNEMNLLTTTGVLNYDFAHPEFAYSKDIVTLVGNALPENRVNDEFHSKRIACTKPRFGEYSDQECDRSTIFVNKTNKSGRTPFRNVIKDILRQSGDDFAEDDEEILQTILFRSCNESKETVNLLDSAQNVVRDQAERNFGVDLSPIDSHNKNLPNINIRGSNRNNIECELSSRDTPTIKSPDTELQKKHELSYPDLKARALAKAFPMLCNVKTLKGISSHTSDSEFNRMTLFRPKRKLMKHNSVITTHKTQSDTEAKETATNTNSPDQKTGFDCKKAMSVSNATFSKLQSDQNFDMINVSNSESDQDLDFVKINSGISPKKTMEYDASSLTEKSNILSGHQEDPEPTEAKEQALVYHRTKLKQTMRSCERKCKIPVRIHVEPDNTFTNKQECHKNLLDKALTNPNKIETVVQCTTDDKNDTFVNFSTGNRKILHTSNADSQSKMKIPLAERIKKFQSKRPKNILAGRNTKQDDDSPVSASNQTKAKTDTNTSSSDTSFVCPCKNNSHFHSSLDASSDTKHKSKVEKTLTSKTTTSKKLLKSGPKVAVLIQDNVALQTNENTLGSVLTVKSTSEDIPEANTEFLSTSKKRRTANAKVIGIGVSMQPGYASHNKKINKSRTSKKQSYKTQKNYQSQNETHVLDTPTRSKLIKISNDHDKRQRETRDKAERTRNFSKDQLKNQDTAAKAGRTRNLSSSDQLKNQDTMAEAGRTRNLSSSDQLKNQDTMAEAGRTQTLSSDQLKNQDTVAKAGRTRNLSSDLLKNQDMAAKAGRTRTLSNDQLKNQHTVANAGRTRNLSSDQLTNQDTVINVNIRSIPTKQVYKRLNKPTSLKQQTKKTGNQLMTECDLFSSPSPDQNNDKDSHISQHGEPSPNTKPESIDHKSANTLEKAYSVASNYSLCSVTMCSQQYTHKTSAVRSGSDCIGDVICVEYKNKRKTELPLKNEPYIQTLDCDPQRGKTNVDSNMNIKIGDLDTGALPRNGKSDILCEQAMLNQSPRTHPIHLSKALKPSIQKNIFTYSQTHVIEILEERDKEKETTEENSQNSEFKSTMTTPFIFSSSNNNVPGIEHTQYQYISTQVAPPKVKEDCKTPIGNYKRFMRGSVSLKLPNSARPNSTQSQNSTDFGFIPRFQNSQSQYFANPALKATLHSSQSTDFANPALKATLHSSQTQSFTNPSSNATFHSSKSQHFANPALKATLSSSQTSTNLNLIGFKRKENPILNPIPARVSPRETNKLPKTKRTLSERLALTPVNSTLKSDINEDGIALSGIHPEVKSNVSVSNKTMYSDRSSQNTLRTLNESYDLVDRKSVTGETYDHLEGSNGSSKKKLVNCSQSNSVRILDDTSFTMKSLGSLSHSSNEIFDYQYTQTPTLRKASSRCGAVEDVARTGSGTPEAETHNEVIEPNQRKSILRTRRSGHEDKTITFNDVEQKETISKELVAVSEFYKFIPIFNIIGGGFQCDTPLEPCRVMTTPRKGKITLRNLELKDFEVSSPLTRMSYESQSNSSASNRTAELNDYVSDEFETVLDEKCFIETERGTGSTASTPSAQLRSSTRTSESAGESVKHTLPPLTTRQSGLPHRPKYNRYY